MIYPYIHGNNLYRAESQTQAENALALNRELIKLFFDNRILAFDLKPKQIIHSNDNFLYICDMEQFIPDERLHFSTKYFNRNKNEAVQSIIAQG
jgi:hypothetical protein